ncbi:MAG: hypothetical protein HY530_08535 [Chloroflexi bacterium]|nr:hypothetical protein [Chloroflexota bacterium]
MDTDDLIRHARRLIESGKKSSAAGALSEVMEFLRVYAGEKSAFFQNLSQVKQSWSDEYIMAYVVSNLGAFIRYAEKGLLEGISIERKAQIDVVSDFLDQANTLLSSKEVHPAAPAVIIGAALEEFLRNWIEEAGLALGGRKPSLDSYTKVLREADLITKQDAKDITSWSGLRNYAAHGEWEEVSDKNRISIMLESVNLFMRKYGQHSD